MLSRSYNLNLTMAPSAVPINDLSPTPQKLATSKMAAAPILEDDEKTDLVVRTFRCLIADLCEQFKGGHPG